MSKKNIYELKEMHEWEVYKRYRKHSINPLTNSFIWMRHEEVYKMIGNLNDDKRILDLGCGDGAFTRVLTCKSRSVVAMDIDAECLNKARAHCLENNDISFVKGDIMSAPFPDATFDVIVCTSALEHVLDLEKAMKEINRLTKIDGFAIVGYPIETRVMRTFMKVLWPRSHSFHRVWFNSRKMNIDDFNKDPKAHKQKYLGIRKAITSYFTITEKTKLPFRSWPDDISYYEICKLKTKDRV